MHLKVDRLSGLCKSWGGGRFDNLGLVLVLKRLRRIPVLVDSVARAHEGREAREKPKILDPKPRKP